MTALHNAAGNGHLEVARLLIERGAKLEAVNNVSNITCTSVCLCVSVCLSVCLSVCQYIYWCLFGICVCVICTYMCVLAF